VTSAPRRTDHARSDRRKGLFVDQDEASGDAVGRIRIHGERHRSAQAYHADVVLAQFAGVGHPQLVDIEQSRHILHDDRRDPGGVLEAQAVARLQRPLLEPAHGGLEGVGDLWWLIGGRDQVAA
jgi:hypothetical protein